MRKPMEVSRIRGLLLILVSLLLPGCGGIRTGNPVPPPTMVSLELGAINNLTVSNLKLCVRTVRLVPADPSASAVISDVNLGEVTVATTQTQLTSIFAPKQDYSAVEIGMDTSCASQKSVQLTNGSGTISTTETTTARFSGAIGFSAYSTIDVKLDIGSLVSQLATVSAGTQIKSAVESSVGSASVVGSCPVGYVRVPGLAGYTSGGFCVARFEARYSGGVAVSQASGSPWTGVDRAAAITACQANGPGYDLIDNDQWQTIARNIEGVAANWSGGAVGSAGGINEGHSDNSPSIMLAASTDDTQACFGTGQTCSDLVWDNQRRIHFLADGSTIWDFSGNVWEWVKDDNFTAYGPDGFVSQLTNSAPFTLPAKDKWGPSGNYASLSSGSYGGLGFAAINYNTGAIMRGGSYADNAPLAGIFRTHLTYSAAYHDATLGFRCVFRP